MLCAGVLQAAGMTTTFQEGGVNGVARKARVSRENIYDAFSKTATPQMKTITKMLAPLACGSPLSPFIIRHNVTQKAGFPALASRFNQ